MFPLTIGLVVILSPSLNLGDPLMKPVIDESPFRFQFTKDGTPRGAPTFFNVGEFRTVLAGGVACLTGGGVCFGAAGADAPFGARKYLNE